MKPVLFFDVDGTLVDPSCNQIPVSTLQTLQELHEQGYLCCISTGRTYANFLTTVAAHAFAWDGYICGNGTEVLDGAGKSIHRECFSNDLVRRVIDTAEKHHHVSLIVTDTGWTLMQQPDDNTRRSLDFLHEPLPEVRDYADEEVLAMIIFADHGYDYQPYLDLKEVRAIPSYIAYADLILSTVSKAKGIRCFLEHVHASQYIAFGDSLNDYDMLEHADVSVAMGQGAKAIQEIADVVTKPVDEDGIAYAVHELDVLHRLCR